MSEVLTFPQFVTNFLFIPSDSDLNLYFRTQFLWIIYFSTISKLTYKRLRSDDVYDTVWIEPGGDPTVIESFSYTIRKLDFLINCT